MIMTNSKIVREIVMEFYKNKRENPDFYVEDLLEYVKTRYSGSVSLQTPYRRMRELQQNGLLNYTVDKSRFTFLYRQEK